MTNYICINGKKAELTEEQMKALGIELPKANPFERVAKDKIYYCISGSGIVSAEREDLYDIDKERFDAGNYCTDRVVMKQRALHEVLSRLLWRYSMEHGGSEIDWWNSTTRKYRIAYNRGEFGIMHSWSNVNVGCVHFTSREIAENAIKEIVKPFMKDHPEFKW